MDVIKKNLSEINHFDLYNAFFFMNDVERLRKFLARHKYFEMVLDVPGDIVELGVFKGTGFLQLLKLREIYMPASNKKVVGFDLFEAMSGTQNNQEETLKQFYKNCQVQNLSIKKSDIEELIDKINFTNKREDAKNKANIYELIEGDVSQSIPEYLAKNPGFRISFLHMDLDVEEASFVALDLLYPHVTRGGIIVFDEYACSKWSESNAVDKFLDKHKELRLKTTSWARTPTAYLIKI